MRIVIHKLKVLILEIKDALHLRIDLHLRKGARLAGKLKRHLLEMICVDVGITCSMDEVTHLQTADLSDHHSKKSIRGNIERHAEEHVSTALIKLA
jgi:hypothetical protein